MRLVQIARYPVKSLQGETPLITLPSGDIYHGPGTETDAALSEWLHKPVRLVGSRDVRAARAEYFADVCLRSSLEIRCV
jgi:hypothetical protein